MTDPRAAFFDQRAAGWETACYPPAVRERLWPLVQSFSLPPGGAVLDMGGGPGTLVPYERRAMGPDGLLVSFDVSFEMVRQATRKVDNALTCPLQASAMRLPFKANRFDTLVCFAAFPHFADKPLALAEMARVAKPGGVIIIAHLLGRAELMRHHKTHPAVANDHLPDEAGMRALFSGAGLADPIIVDEPGRYLAKSVKP